MCNSNCRSTGAGLRGPKASVIDGERMPSDEVGPAIVAAERAFLIGG